MPPLLVTVGLTCYAYILIPHLGFVNPIFGICQGIFMGIYERINEIIKSNKDLSQKNMAISIGAPSSTVNNWLKSGRAIPADYVASIADYLHVSYEYLLTGKDSEAKSLRYEGLSSDEEEMLALFRQLPQKEQYKLMGRMEEKIESLHDDAEAPVAAGNLLQAK